MNSVAWVMAIVKVFPSDSRKGGGGEGGGSARAYSTDVHDAQCMMRSAWSAVHGAQCNTKESPCYFELIEKF